MFIELFMMVEITRTLFLRKQICLHPDATKLRPCALPVLDQSWSTSMPGSSHLILLLGLPLILGASLPRSGPVPEEKPTDGKQQAEVLTSGRSAEKDDPSPAEVPKPEPKPDLPDNTEDQKSAGENQRQPKSADEESLQNEKAPSSTKQRPPKPLENEDPRALRECLAALTEL